MLDCVTFTVFSEDFQRGFGADGDHLKTDEEVAYALSSDYTMITLDCSEQIRNDITAMTDAEIETAYHPSAEWENLYDGKTFTVEDQQISFGGQEFHRACLIYAAALDHATHIYETFIQGKPVDFEI